MSDNDTLETYLKAGIRAQTISYSGSGIGDPTALPAVSGAGSTSQPVSGTNLQEAGVDEADRIKSDGEWLYVLHRPYTELMLRVMRLAGTPSPGATEQSRLSLGMNIGGDGLYLFSANSGTAGLDRLAVVGSSGYFYPCWYSPWTWRNGGVDVTIVNVADRANPAVGTRLHIDGHLVSTRRIGDILYVVSRYAPSLPGYDVYPATDDARSRNEALLQSTTLSALLPNWQVDGIDKGDLFAADACYLTPTAQEDYTPDMVTVTAINLRSPTAAPKSVCMLGPSETLYASTDAIYLATTRSHYEQGPAQNLVAMPQYSPEMSTDVHKFALTASGPVFRGSANLPGHLGWHQDKKPFRFGEHNGVLRVVTSSGSWESEDIRLTILAEQDGALVERAHLPNTQRAAKIGKPGERLYAVRFVGNRGFVVTFRIVDPLYVLDLSDPADPFIAGELQITGYSDYLHPVDETHLLGIGKDALPADGDGDGRGAWYQGVKISLFDISDPAEPKETASRVIGKRGTDAGVLGDHHALAWLPADPAANRPARLALPVDLHETPGYYTSLSPSSWYDWTHRGLYLFDIDPAAGSITPRDALVIADRAGASPPDDRVDADRAVITGSDVHYVSGDKVWSGLWGNAASLSPVQ